MSFVVCSAHNDRKLFILTKQMIYYNCTYFISNTHFQPLPNDKDSVDESSSSKKKPDEFLQLLIGR